jgi:hypothetical protein
MAHQPIIDLNLEEDFEGGALHKPNTLVITLSGPQTHRASYSWIASALISGCHLDPNCISSVYRLEDPKRFYVKLTDAGHIKYYKDLHGKKCDFPEHKISLMIEHLEKEKMKGSIHWLPWTTKATTVKKIATHITGDNNVDVYPIKSAGDVWTFAYTPQKDREVPFYLTAKVSSQMEADKYLKIFITLPGRRTPCGVCGDTSHWISQCPKRKQQRKDAEREAPVFEHPPQDLPPTHSKQSESSDVPKDQRQPTDDGASSKRDGFTIVSNKKKRKIQDKSSPNTTRLNPQKTRTSPPSSPRLSPNKHTHIPSPSCDIEFDLIPSPCTSWTDVDESPPTPTVPLELTDTDGPPSSLISDNE